MPKKNSNELTFKVQKGESINAAVARLRAAMEEQEMKSCYNLLKKYGYTVSDPTTLESELMEGKKSSTKENESKKEDTSKEDTSSNTSNSPF